MNVIEGLGINTYPDVIIVDDNNPLWLFTVLEDRP